MYSVKVDAGEGKVVVAGDVEPEKLVKKLKMGGKHAEIWGGKNNRNYPINPQFQNMQFGKNKGIKSQNLKGQKEGDSGGGGQGKVGQTAQFPNMKGVQDNLKVPVKEQKSVKFSLPEEEFDGSDDEYEDNFEDYDDDEEEGEELGHGHGHHPMHHNKMMPKMGEGRGPHGPAGVINGPAINNGHKDNAGGSRNNNGSDKKGDVIDQAMVMKGKGGNYNDSKVDNNEGRKSSQKGKKKKGDGGLLGRFLSFGKKSNKVGLGEATYTNKSKNQNNESGNNKGKEGKKGEAKLKDHSNSKNDFDFHDYDKTPLLHKNGKVGQMNPVPKVGNYPMGHQAVQDDASGHYQGMQMQHVPYNNLQQQQYMGMMMNQPQYPHHYQHETNMNMMYPTNMMYGRPHPSMNYMAPPPMPSHPMADPITHTFSDENVESCSIM